jgi:hypothetical protein
MSPMRVYNFLGGQKFVALEDYEKLERKLDEIVWGHHLDERVCCDCTHCIQYNKWLEKEA